MQRGSTIIEVLIGVSVAVVGLLALIQIATKSVNNTGYATRQAQANSYASQAMEDVRTDKERLGWTAFKNANGAGTSCSSVGENNEFNRCITISYANNASTNNIEQMAVYIEVSWPEVGRESGSTRPSAKLHTVFTRY